MARGSLAISTLALGLALAASPAHSGAMRLPFSGRRAGSRWRGCEAARLLRGAAILFVAGLLVVDSPSARAGTLPQIEVVSD